MIESPIICDMTLPFLSEYPGREAMLERYHKLGTSYVSLSIGMDGMNIGQTMRDIADARALIDRNPDKYVLVRHAEDIRSAKTTGRLAVAFNFQGCDPLEGNVNLLSAYHALGLNQMLLVYNQMNAATTGCHEKVDAGLSRYGERLIGEMNRLGMLVDCTHTGYRATLEIMEMSSAPVLFSHSNCRAIWEHERNITDEQILACAATGGLIGVTGVGKFMSGRGTAEVSDILPHIRHLVELVGPGHVGLGINNVYFVEQLYELFRSSPDRWPNGYPPPPWHYFAPEQVPELAEALLRDGLSESDVRGILGENFLAIADKVWR